MTNRETLLKTKGRYKTNKTIRKKIDAILKDNAIMFQNIGNDTPKSVRLSIKKKEWSNNQKIKMLDYSFYKRLCPYEKPFE